MAKSSNIGQRALVALLMMLSWGAMQWPASAPAQDQPQVRAKLGIAVPLSGDFAPMGRQVLETARFALSDLDVDLEVRDTRGQPADAARAIEELAALPGLVAIVGPMGQRESQAAATMAARQGVPLFTLSSVEEINQSSPWVFRLRISPKEQAHTLAEAAYVRLGLRRVAVFWPANDYGREAATAFARAFMALGGEIRAAVDYDEGTTNFTHALEVLVGKKVALRSGQRITVGSRQVRADRHGFATIRAREVIDFDGLFIPDFHPTIARVLPFLPRVGLQSGAGGDGAPVQLLGLSGWQGQSMTLTGAHAAGAIYTDVFVGRDEGGRSETFAVDFSDAMGRAPVGLDAEVYDGVRMLGLLIAANGTDDAITIRRSLPATVRGRSFRGICGDLGFGAHGEPLRPGRLFRFDVDGLVVPLD